MASSSSAPAVAKSTAHFTLRSKKLSHTSNNIIPFRVSPNSRVRVRVGFSLKGLHSGWNHSTVVKAAPNEFVIDGSSDDAVPPSTRIERPSTEPKDAKPSNELSPADLAVESSVSEFITQVSSLVKLVDSRDVVELKLKQFDCEILIRKRGALPQPPSSTPVVSPPATPQAFQGVPPVTLSAPSTQPPPAASRASSPAAKSPSSSLPPLKSPMAGTFYRSPGPGESAFVKVGDKVKKGQVLCIIEAMKLMNEIEADQSGTIVDILGEDGKPVSVDSPLFVIQP